ncbi:SOS response-associated peptidase [Opitutaceae bacterium TAV3]|nr:SOS response-associated peptidase [Opitutaceae bacterium TAV3]
MCCRFLLMNDHARALLARLGATLEARLAAETARTEADGGGEGDCATEFVSRYNIAPGSRILAVRSAAAQGAATGDGGTRDGVREAVRLRWGLVPSWARSPGGAGQGRGAPPVNARAESVAEKPMFRDALRQRRCVILASGFYEWERRGGARLPWLFQRADGEPFLLAGLWDSWRPPDGGALESCTMITTAANAVMAPIHHRMPVMLSATEAEEWLEPRVTPMSRMATLTSLLHPWDEAMTAAVRVSTRVNNARFEGPECLDAPPPGEGGADAQMSLVF